MKYSNLIITGLPRSFDVGDAVDYLQPWSDDMRPEDILYDLYPAEADEEKESGFNAGALIGTIERWLILLFVCLGRYDALGLLIAAKSIIRFSEKDTAKTEYVLAGTLLSIFIAVLAGMMVIGVK